MLRARLLPTQTVSGLHLAGLQLGLAVAVVRAFRLGGGVVRKWGGAGRIFLGSPSFALRNSGAGVAPDQQSKSPTHREARQPEHFDIASTGSQPALVAPVSELRFQREQDKDRQLRFSPMCVPW